jgi:hypothetical protein
MKINTRQAYGLAAVLAIIAAILQLTTREWFRAGTGVVLALTMVLAATGFPERSETNKRVYYVVLGFLIVLLSIQIITRLRGSA